MPMTLPSDADWAICAYLMPPIPVASLKWWQDPALRFQDHGLHEMAILLVTIALNLLCGGTGGRPLLHYFTHAFAWFTLSSLGFVWAEPWNHLCWFSRATFAIGFSILGFGVCKAYLNGRGLDQVIGVASLFGNIEQHNAQMKDACQTLSGSTMALTAQIESLERSQVLGLDPALALEKSMRLLLIALSLESTISRGDREGNLHWLCLRRQQATHEAQVS